MQKVSQKVKTDEILTACFNWNLHLCYNFAFVLHEKCTRFQPNIKQCNFSCVLLGYGNN